MFVSVEIQDTYSLLFTSVVGDHIKMSLRRNDFKNCQTTQTRKLHLTYLRYPGCLQNLRKKNANKSNDESGI